MFTYEEEGEQRLESFAEEHPSPGESRRCNLLKLPQPLFFFHVSMKVMLKLQTKTSEGFDSNLKGKCIEEVYCLVDTYPESSDKSGFTVQVLETSGGDFIYFPPTKNPDLYVDDTLYDVYETVESLKNEGYIVGHDG